MCGFRSRLQRIRSPSQETLALALKAAVLAVTTLVVFYQDLVMIFDDALQNEATSYLLIVPFLLAYMIYRKRKMVKASVTSVSPKLWKLPINEVVGALLLLTSFLLYWYGSYTFTPLEYHVLALPFFVSACILVLFNVQTLRQLLFPVLFLFLLVPPPAEILYNVGSLLSTVSSELAYNLLQLFSFPVSLSFESGTPTIFMTSQAGDVIQLAVDVACSGIYSQIGFLIFALFTAYIIRDKPWKKAVVFLLGFPLIYALNVLRITIIGVLGYFYGEAIILDLFHLLGGWILIFIGTMILLVVSEKVFRTHIMANPAEKCPECSTAGKDESSFCFNCGKIQNIPLSGMSKRDIAKIASLILTVALIISIQTPVFALTQGPPEVILQTAQGGNVTTHILPQFPDYSLIFLYRDTDFEKLAKQDASLVYAYIPNNETREMVWVTLEIAATKTSLHRWETCLVTYPVSHGRQAKVTQIQLKDTTLLQNPPIIGRFFAFNNTATNETQAVLYWYETSIFKINNTSQQKQVKISLITYPNGTQNLPDIENQLLALATKLVGYWQPIKTWSQIALLISQSGDKLIALTIIAIGGIYTYNLTEKRREKRQNTIAYRKLSQTNKQIVDAVHETETKTLPTLNNILNTYNANTKKPLQTEEMIQKLDETEKLGLTKSKIANRYDEPIQTWKTCVNYPKPKLIQRIRTGMSSIWLRIKHKR